MATLNLTITALGTYADQDASNVLKQSLLNSGSVAVVNFGNAGNALSNLGNDNAVTQTTLRKPNSKTC